MTKAGAASKPDILVISDGKAGHYNQSLGLAEALCRLRPAARLEEQPATRGSLSLVRALLPRFRDPEAPALVIGAGHGTHANLLQWRRRGSRAIVLMRPSLPLRFFDLCIEPRHDGGLENERRLLSKGPLNRIRPSARRSDEGLLLIGGPSPHFEWNSQVLLGQIARICDGERRWLLSTSRRTPATFLPALRELELPGLDIHDATALPAGWLAEKLSEAAQSWVTPDSASMVYEALSGGGAVGLFDLPPAADSRVAAGIQSLVSQQLCTTFAAFDTGTPLRAPEPPLAEADRIARLIEQRGWLP